jgi:hypothetical protein
MARGLGLDVQREPHFPVRVPGFEGRRPDLLFKDWEQGRDLFVDVVGSSPLAASNLGGFVPGGAASRAVLRKESSYRDILVVQPPSVAFTSFAFESLGGLHPDACAFLSRLQASANMAAVNHDDMVGYSVLRRVSFAIAKAVGRQLSTRLPWWGGFTPA